MEQTRGTLLQRLSRPWFRGPASQDGTTIVMKGGPRAEWYEPLAFPHIGMELQRVRTPADAVAFVSRFGPLRGLSVLRGKPCPEEVREPFEDFERAAEDLRRTIRTLVNVRKAGDGDADALARLREQFVVRADAPVSTNAGDTRVVRADAVMTASQRLENASDRHVLLAASEDAAWRLNDGLLAGDARPYVYDPNLLFGQQTPPGRLRIGVLPEDLLGFCYLTVAQTLATSERVAACDGCAAFFIATDGRQRYCQPQCSSRGRYRKWQHKKQQRERQGEGHAQETRARRR